MAQRHKSAIKRNRQNEKRRARNRAIRTAVRHEVREAREAIASGGDAAAAETQLRSTIKALNKAASKGVIHRNAASRQVARLSKRAAALRKPSQPAAQ